MRTGEWALAAVTGLLTREYEGGFAEVRTATGVIRATADHPFWVVEGAGLPDRPAPRHVPAVELQGPVPGRWVDARELQAEDRLISQLGKVCGIRSVVGEVGQSTVYNLTVEGVHTFAVGTDHILVHNRDDNPEPPKEPGGGAAEHKPGSDGGAEVAHEDKENQPQTPGESGEQAATEAAPNTKNCFGAGTPLLTPSGSRKIEEFRRGDLVLSRDEWDPSGVAVAKAVEEVYTGNARVVDLEVGGKVIRTTAEHLFWVRGRGWTEVSIFEPGYELIGHDGQRSRVEGISEVDEVVAVYNIRVADHHTYFVGTQEWGWSVWAHNAYAEFSAELKARGGTEEESQDAWEAARQGDRAAFEDAVGSTAKTPREMDELYNLANAPVGIDRDGAHAMAMEAAGIPADAEPVQVVIFVDPQNPDQHAAAYQEAADNPSTEVVETGDQVEVGRVETYLVESPDGSMHTRYVVDHTADSREPHFHAAQPQGDPADAVEFGKDTVYDPITHPDLPDHHIPYDGPHSRLD
jgi:hypothetical protein